VIGVLASKGVSQFVSSDNNAYIPVINGKRSWPISEKASYVITIGVTKYQLLNPAVSEAEGEFRIIRKTPLGINNDFEILRSDDLAHELISNLKFVTWACVFIAVITLLGAAIGLMNIMLVSVNERTREIGISKAIGANNRTILKQFLLESILICQIGGLLGIVLGIAIGNAVSLMMGSPFFIPWQWISLGLVICFAVGILAGIYPAVTAAKLNPINALREE
jgi:putative ABC transport system permease protein